MKPTYLLTVACITASLAACVSSSPIYLSDGSSGHQIRCDGFFAFGADTNKCLQQAGKICGDRGYRRIRASGYSMIIQCNSPSVAPTFVSLSDDAIAARLLGTWSCSVEAAESHASAQSVSTYSRDGKYTSTGTLSFTSEGSGSTIKFSSSSNGNWRVENGRVIGTARNIQFRGLTDESQEMVDVVRQNMPKPGEAVAIRFTALTNDHAVAVSESNDGYKQYCRKQPG